MSAELRESLLDSSSPPLYVLLFPNVFNSQGVRENEEYKGEIDTKKAKKVLERLLHHIKFNLRQIESRQLQIESNQSLYEAISSKINWSEGKIRKADFVRDIVSVIVWILQVHCELNVNLYLSRDQTQVFCTLHSLDEVLERRAEFIRYRLQMSKPSEFDPNSDFMQVFPYVEFHQSLKEREVNGLMRYDDNGEETEKGSLFTLCDKTRLVFSIISSGFSLSWLQEKGLLLDHYCVHKTLHKDQLLRRWATLSALFKPQPLSMVRNYFGEKVALYFAWINFYYNAMMWPAAAGGLCFLLSLLSDKESNKMLTLSFSVFLAIWASVFDYLWSRSERKLAWKWGTVNSADMEEQRAEFQGPLTIDPITGKFTKKREGTIGTLKRLLSFSVLAVFVTMVIAAVIGIFIYRAILLRQGDQDGPLLCALLNAVQIRVMNVVYTIVARKMNDWENHETETKYMDAFSLKLFLFRFVNCYVSLFYIAFIKQYFEGCEGQKCSEELAFQLAIIFLMNMSLNLMELGWPYADYWIRGKMEERKAQRLRNEHPERLMRNVLSPTEKQAQLDSYDTPMEDYMEMVCQYGYIVLFSSVFPVVALLALIEILVEIRVDAWKLCKLNRRPFPYRTDSIGIWHNIILMVSYIGIATNSALIIFDSQFPVTLLPFGPWLNFLVLEHLFLTLKYLIAFLAPREPTVVHLGLIWQDRIASEMMFTKKIQFMEELKLMQMRQIKENSRSSFSLKAEDLKTAELG